MPASGARSGTTPNRPTQGGTGTVGPHQLSCGHTTHNLLEVAKYPSGKRTYRCPHCKNIVERRPGRAKT